MLAESRVLTKIYGLHNISKSMFYIWCSVTVPITSVMIHLLFIHRVEFTQLAADYKAVNLGQGFPDFSPPNYLQEAFCKALTGGCSMHQYTRAFVR